MASCEAGPVAGTLLASGASEAVAAAVTTAADEGRTGWYGVGAPEGVLLTGGGCGGGDGEYEWGIPDCGIATALLRW